MIDLITTFNNLIGSQESAYFAGLIAAFTPCVLAIIPIFLYRFGIWDLSAAAGKQPLKQVLKDIALLVVGFLVSFAAAGLLLQSLLTSDLVNVTRLVLGYTLVLIGILQLSGRLSLQFMAKFSNPLLIGLVAPWIISLSPCVLPYFAGLVLTAVTGDTLLKFMLFGLGVLTPAIILSFAGNRILSVFKKFTKVLLVIERWAALLIIFSGIYITAELITLTTKDILLAGSVILVEIAVVASLVFRRPAGRTLLNYGLTVIMITADLVATLILASQAVSAASVSGLALLHACNGNQNSCPVCGVAAVVFLSLAAGLAVSYLLSARKGRTVRFTFRDDNSSD